MSTSGTSSIGYSAVLTRTCWRVLPPWMTPRPTQPTATPIDNVLVEIERALSKRFYYLALVTALSLPDICAALESSDGRSVTKRYKAWYKLHLGARSSMEHLSEDDCFSLRCGVVHQGRFGLAGSQYSRVIFALPHNNNIFVGCISEDAYFVSIVEFCHEFTDA